MGAGILTTWRAETTVTQTHTHSGQSPHDAIHHYFGCVNTEPSMDFWDVGVEKQLVCLRPYYRPSRKTGPKVLDSAGKNL